MSWPAYSPDLNSTDLVWAKMKEIVDGYIDYEQQQTNWGLKEVMYEAWEEISTQHLKNIINSMGRRCETVIAAEGGPTPY